MQKDVELLAEITSKPESLPLQNVHERVTELYIKVAAVCNAARDRPAPPRKVQDFLLLLQKPLAHAVWTLLLQLGRSGGTSILDLPARSLDCVGMLCLSLDLLLYTLAQLPANRRKLLSCLSGTGEHCCCTACIQAMSTRRA